MPTATSFSVAGSHSSPDQRGSNDEQFDAIDVVVHCDDHIDRMLGLRTAGYLHRLNGRPELWDEGYRSLPVTLDFSTVKFWDFNEVLWLGPTPHDCLVWSNAISITTRSIAYLLDPARPESLILHGPNGSGLPSPREVGVILRVKTNRIDVDGFRTIKSR